MSKDLEKLAESLGENKNPSQPPIHLWDPDLSGDIDILIRRDGSWIHEGGEIKRQSLVNLFASILRRESDGEYYLVTPVEKWRLRVECLPLLIVDFDLREEGTDSQVLQVETNTGRRYEVGEKYPLFTPDDSISPEGVATVELEHGLAALFSRAAWLRLVEAAANIEKDRESDEEGLFLLSHSQHFRLG